MKLQMPCSACGQPLDVDEQTLANAAALGVTLTAAHDVCPTATPTPEAETPPLRTFRVEILLFEGDILDVAPAIAAAGDSLLAAIGHTTEARNFPEAVNGPFTTWLNHTWPTLQENAALADIPVASPASPR